MHHKIAQKSRIRKRGLPRVQWRPYMATTDEYRRYTKPTLYLSKMLYLVCIVYD